jgi:hypothetical protein
VAAETPETNPEPPLETLSDRELILRIARMVQHLDPMVHEVHQWAGRAAPLLDRFGGFGRAVRKAGARHG